MNLTAAAQAVAGSNLITVVPRLGSLAFRIRLPEDWHRFEPPAEPVDFDDLAALLPAGVFHAPCGAVVFSVAARPAYAAGVPRQWLEFLCAQRGLVVKQLGSVNLAGRTAAVCSAAQAAADGWRRLQVALFADTGRLYTLTACAPESLWPAVRGAFDTMFASFALVEN